MGRGVIRPELHGLFEVGPGLAELLQPVEFFAPMKITLNVLRIGFVADLLTRNGVGVIVSAISPFKEARDQVRRSIGENFLEVYVDAPIEVCAERDVKGLYKKAFAGEIPQFTGVSDPYEPPAAPELHIKTTEEEPHESARRVLLKLEELGYLQPVREFNRA